MSRTKNLISITLFFLFMSLGAQSRIVQEAPWHDEPVQEEKVTGPVFEPYVTLEFLGGNLVNYGLGSSFFEGKLDAQIQGAFTYYEFYDEEDLSDDYRKTTGWTLGGEVTHHPVLLKNLGIYYGLFYRYNHFDNTEITNFNDTHWTGLNLGGEIRRERLTFYMENLWFVRNLTLEIPLPTVSLGVKWWLL